MLVLPEYQRQCIGIAIYIIGGSSVNELLKTYIDRLKNYDKFHIESSKTQYFTYFTDSSVELAKLRSEFCIEDIAKGCFFEKVISLMNWIHKELFFVGDNVTPKENNTHDIMNIRKTGALFCRYHVIVLTEMLASIGITARVISCLPEIFDNDSHITVLVFDNDSSRWFFVDPTFNTFFCSDNDDALDIFQIRDMYKSGKIPKFKHISINKQWDLVCNGVVCETYDEWYTIYMAKNTFRFMSPADTYYNCLSDKNISWIAINPLGYNQKNQYDKDKNITYIHCINEFLQNPELMC